MDENKGKELISSDYKVKKNWKIILGLTIPIILIGIVIGLVFTKKTEDFSVVNTTELTDVEIQDICDILDYSAIIASWEPYASFNSTFLYDADNDNRAELFTVTDNKIYEGVSLVMGFDTIDTAVMSTGTHNGTEYRGQIISNENKLYLAWGGKSGTYTNYETWGDNGWVKTPKELGIEYIDGNTINYDIGQLPRERLLSGYYATSNPEALISKYSEHLSSVFDDRFYKIVKDIDSDGEDETILIVQNFVSNWAQNLTTTGTDGILMEKFVEGTEDFGAVAFLFDENANGVVHHTFSLGQDVKIKIDAQGNINNTFIYWEDGELIIKFVNNKDVLAKTYFFAPADLCEKNDTPNQINDVAMLYTKYLKKHKYNDVMFKYADICSADGNEIVFVCDDGLSKHVTACAVYCGRVIDLYNRSNENDSIFIIENNGSQAVFCYSQSTMRVESSYAKCYEYYIYSFNECYNTCSESDVVIIRDNSIPTKRDNAFFDKVNSCINVGTICVDDLGLIGYNVMNFADADYYEETDKKYLAISNCNTSKKGNVKVNYDSWLNFRKGPSLKNEKILMNENDPESFVKQMNGSVVTVIDTKNTGDKENPIWVKIQIKYENQELIGYSSCRYITLSEIKHLSVGEKFTVEAKTNDTGVIWTSNDNNVIAINKTTGEVQAKSKGLVVVTASTDSGLKDSCLILVE